MCVHLSESTFPSDTTPSELFYTGSFSYIEPQMLGGKARMLHLNKDSFSAALDASPLPAVVMFYANWCSKCAMMKPVPRIWKLIFRTESSFMRSMWKNRRSWPINMPASWSPPCLYQPGNRCRRNERYHRRRAVKRADTENLQK